MLNRQIALLFSVGVVIGLAGFLIAMFTPERPRAQGPGWAPEGLIWAILAMAVALLFVSQALIIRSVWRARVTNQPALGTTKTMELVWSVAPAAMVAGALAYSLVVT